MRKVSLVLGILIGLMFTGIPSWAESNPIEANLKKWAKAQREKAPAITVDAFKAIKDKDEFFFELVDIRTNAEYQAGHLGEALHLDRNKLEWLASKKLTDWETPIYIYCKGGSRGAMATLRLKEIGYKNVTNITGGVEAWAKAGYPLYNQLGEYRMTPEGVGKKPE
ncbi:MAG: rhodanese-like domain-containing protein [Desulfobacterales bacterium]|nr:rhodanese-like domain-containing protein [Desulfobacterales bacterium]